MRKTLLTILAIFLIIILAGVVFWLFRGRGLEVPPPDGGTIFPGSNGGTGGGQTDAKLQIPSSSGEPITTNNFLANGITIEDPANEGNYYLAGSSGACNPNGTCPTAGSEKGFTIVYFNSSKSFIVNLDDEPLGENRMKAERYLMNMLGISQSQMCNLRYDVLTTSYVNEQYSAQNLGFSFCPGAVQLP